MCSCQAGLGDLDVQHAGGLGLLHVCMPGTAAAAGGTRVTTDSGFIHVVVPTWRRVSPGQGTVAAREEQNTGFRCSLLCEGFRRAQADLILPHKIYLNSKFLRVVF